MSTSQIHIPRRFFASANGSDGFRSYFDEIFPSERLEAVFILKGGPGTGKSTLLFALAKAFDLPNIQTEFFYCSSDPRSLDGLLLTHAGRSVCVLDGTSPHERDARLPGACDRLIDLGSCFDTNRLKSEKKHILELQKKKSAAYKEAYFYLSLFGVFNDKIKAEIQKRVKKEEIKIFAKQSILPLIHKSASEGFVPRLIRAFSREGLMRFNTYEEITETKIVFSGEENATSIVLEEIFSMLCASGCGGYVAPSPLAKDNIDGIFLASEKISVTAKKEPEGESCDRFFEPADSEENARLCAYRAEAERFLSLAKQSLQKASESHFALEKIYTPAVDFGRMHPLKEALIKEISKNLAITEIS